MTEHPIEQHVEMLASLRREVDGHEIRLRTVELVSAKREEQMRGLYENVGAIKELLAQQTQRLETMLDNFDKRIGETLKDMDIRLKNLEGADGKKWQQAVWVVFSLVVGAIVGTLFGR